MIRKASRIAPLALAFLMIGCGGSGSSSGGSYTVLASDATNAFASATSPNGSLVVGREGTSGVLWSSANDATILTPPAGSIVVAVNAVTNAGTAFGSLSVDNGVTTTPASYAVATGWTVLAFPAGVTSATIKGVSEDGSVVLAGSPAGLYYVKNGTATSIPNSASDSNAVLSYDGTTIFEVSSQGVSQRKIDAATSTILLQPTATRTITGASGAGGAVVGTINLQNSSNTRGYRYIVSGSQFDDVSTIGDDVSSEAVAIDRAGVNVVGDSIASNGTREPFVWTGAHGIKKLSNGVSGAFRGLTAIHTTGFSADDSTVVGYGTDSAGVVRSWKVRR